MRPAAFLILFFLLCLPAFSATIIVPDDCPTIQAAIDAAVDGDTVAVRPGTYVENISFLGKAIAVRSLEGPGVTVIDGGSPPNPDLGSVVSFTNGEDRQSELEGFTITNGTGTKLSGAQEAAGGGIYCNRADPAITCNIITCNRAAAGGGIFCIDRSSPAVTGNIIADNAGGGITVYYNQTRPRLVIRDNEFFGNTNDRNGGAIFCHVGEPEGHPDGKLYIERNLIRANTAARGGGIYCLAGDDDVVFISDNTITENRAVDFEGGGGLWISGTPKVIGNVIAANEADGEGGGAFIGCHNRRIRFANNQILFNRARRGGGIATYGNCYEIPLVNNTIAYNRAEKGGGLFLRKTAVVAANTILWNNQATIEGDQIHVQALPNASCSLTMRYCDLEGGMAGVSVENENWAHLHVGPKNIDADPVFADPGTSDCHLALASPCIDAGDENALNYILPNDFEGDPRIAGYAVDIGADEFYFHLYQTGRVTPGNTIKIKIVGVPGMPVWLARGRDLLPAPIPTKHGDLWLSPSEDPFWSLGAIPASGVLVLLPVVPPMALPGEYPFQAIVGLKGGPFTRLTNPMILKVE